MDKSNRDDFWDVGAIRFHAELVTRHSETRRFLPSIDIPFCLVFPIIEVTAEYSCDCLLLTEIKVQKRCKEVPPVG